ncbi:MAG: hypothetical protein ACRCS6_11530 [Turicibacter sp.]
MEAIKNQVSLIASLKNQLETAELKLDTLIHDQFLEVNGFKSNSVFLHKGKEICQTTVSNGGVKGYFLKKDGEVSKSIVKIDVDENYKIKN